MKACRVFTVTVAISRYSNGWADKWRAFHGPKFHDHQKTPNSCCLCTKDLWWKCHILFQIVFCCFLRAGCKIWYVLLKNYLVKCILWHALRITDQNYYMFIWPFILYATTQACVLVFHSSTQEDSSGISCKTFCIWFTIKRGI